tara:strand:+ start:222 stop:674 length:453 start_codon:yes stop_codon:yes gene_type:complete
MAKESLIRPDKDGKKKVKPQPEGVAAGAVEKALDLAFNPNRDKIREVTIIDRIQGRLLPMLDMINEGRKFILEIAEFRENPMLYAENHEDRERPIPPDMTDEFVHRLAQWQKSVQGVNLGRITDIALAETEARAGEDEGLSGGRDPWGNE